MWIFLILLALPIVEIALFIEVGGLIGLWPTLALVLLSAVVGTAVMRAQGLRALGRLQASVEAGRSPAGPIADGALILVAGILLVLPGFFTDALGILLLIPPVRRLVIGWGAARLTVRAAGFARGRRGPLPASSDTIEGEYQIIDDDPPAGAGRSGWTRPHS